MSARCDWKDLLTEDQQACACYVWAVSGASDGEDIAAVIDKFHYSGAYLSCKSIPHKQGKDMGGKLDTLSATKWYTSQDTLDAQRTASLEIIAELFGLEAGEGSKPAYLSGNFGGTYDQILMGTKGHQWFPEHMWISYDGFAYDTFPNVTCVQKMKDTTSGYLSPSETELTTNQMRSIQVKDLHTAQKNFITGSGWARYTSTDEEW